ncbi:MAG TPA: phage tail protein [Kofleriaceae bacterium]|nr:phage tail protein [Kofleriaceae bacterium]
MAIGTNSTRAYSAAHFVLELDQTEIAGFFRSVEGGGVKSDILTYNMGSNADQWHQLGKPKYEDVKIQVGMSMSQTFYTWIESFFAGKVLRKNGAILAGDFHYKERARREMYDVLISEVTIPKFDASDRAPCYMGVTLVPERLEFAAGSHRDLSPHVAALQQKLWTPNHFEFIISGFEQATRRTTKIESFTIKQQILEYKAGNRRNSTRVPSRVVFPNLTFFVPEADAKPLVDHFTARVISGAPPPPTRIDGAITATDSDNAPLCTISLYGIDIASIGPDKSDSTSQDIKQVRVDITVERMQFQYAQGMGQLA